MNAQFYPGVSTSKIVNHVSKVEPNFSNLELQSPSPPALFAGKDA